MPKRLLLVAWDAADWSILQPLIDAGEMPALGRLVETGASGELFSTQPLLPVAQWTTLATGKRAWQHRVCHPVERITGANEAVPVTCVGRGALTIWELLARSGKGSMAVGWPASHGARTENTLIVSDRYPQPTARAGIKPWPPAASGTYWPESIRDRLDRLRVSPEDIQADVISRYIPQWKKIDQKRDRRLGLLRVLLARDFSHQAAATALLAGREWDFAAVRFPALGGITQAFLAYHAPRLPWISETEFELYQDVMQAACRMLDKMLGLLIQDTGSRTAIIVVSTHGATRRALSPATIRSNNEAWKSLHGIFAACGPPFATQARVVGASILDVAPTILTWYGLPIGDDMEGRVLLESLAQPHEVKRVASWEAPSPSASAPITESNSAQDDSKATPILRREYDWNLAQSFLEAGRTEEALPILDRLFRAFPERPELAQALFQCQITLQRLAEAGETLEVLLERLPPGIWSFLPRAELCLARKEMREARALVAEAWNCRPSHPEAMRRLGMLLMRLRDWSALAELAQQALKADENEPLAWLGLAEAQLRQRHPAEAEEAAMRAIASNYYMAEAYFVLARALIAQGKWQQAREAMHTLMRLQPNNRAAAAYSRRTRIQWG